MAWYASSKAESVIPFEGMVILESSWEYDRWIRQTKRFFLDLDVWQYCDVDARREDRAVEPTPPRTPTDSGSLISADELQIYRHLREMYDRRCGAMWKARNYLSLSVAETLHPLLSHHSTLDGKLQQIKRRFEPSEAQRLAMFDTRLEPLQAGWKANDREQWLTDWLTLHIDIRDTQTANYGLASHFVAAVYRRDNSIANALGAAIAGQLTTDFEDVVYLCRDLLASQLPENDRSNATPRKDASNSQPRIRRGKPKGCGKITGKPESDQCANLNECNVVNASKRPPKDERTDEWNKWFENYLRFCRRVPTFAYGAVRHGCPEAKKIIDQRQGRGFESDPQKDDDDPGDRQACSTCAVDTAAECLHNRWLFSTGSDVHIINDTSKANFVMTDTATSKITFGNQTVETGGVGTATLPLYKHDLQREVQITLSNCVYLPGYYTNIVSESRLQAKDHYFNGKDDAIYTTVNGSPRKIFQLIRRGAGLTFFNVLTPSAGPQQSPSTAPVVHSSCAPLPDQSMGEIVGAVNSVMLA